MKKFKVTIKGIVPLLQHRFPSEREEEKAKKVSGSRDYSEEVELSLYKDEKGQIYQPADHILNAMIKAAGDFRIAGRGKKTYSAPISSLTGDLIVEAAHLISLVGSVAAKATFSASMKVKFALMGGIASISQAISNLSILAELKAKVLVFKSDLKRFILSLAKITKVFKKDLNKYKFEKELIRWPIR